MANDRGYLHPDYAQALSEFGSPQKLPQSGGWILRREIPGTDACDAMGCYPIFSCLDWSRLNEDLQDVTNDLVSIVVVTDPFGCYTMNTLQTAFPDLAAPFKEHFIADAEIPPTRFVSKHHQYYARKALAKVDVELCSNPAQMVDQWSELYSHVVRRYQLRGIKAFSRHSFARQLAMPGMVMLQALHNGQIVGAHLWCTQGDVAFSHLAASTCRGYELMAAYALYWRALEYFADKTRWVDWGGAAGSNLRRRDGLTQFKQGWASGTRKSFICGRICDRKTYEAIVRATGRSGSRYFPSYREGELSSAELQSIAGK